MTISKELRCDDFPCADHDGVFFTTCPRCWIRYNSALENEVERLRAELKAMQNHELSSACISVCRARMNELFPETKPGDIAFFDDAVNFLCLNIKRLEAELKECRKVALKDAAKAGEAEGEHDIGGNQMTDVDQEAVRLSRLYNSTNSLETVIRMAIATGLIVASEYVDATISERRQMDGSTERCQCEYCLRIANTSRQLVIMARKLDVKS